MRTVLHYSARCENADTRSLINDEATAQGADELAKDSVNNENKNILHVIASDVYLYQCTLSKT